MKKRIFQANLFDDLNVDFIETKQSKNSKNNAVAMILFTLVLLFFIFVTVFYNFYL